MTNFTKRHPAPDATSTPSAWRVFKTLLWAEHAPRRQGLIVFYALQLLLLFAIYLGANILLPIASELIPMFDLYAGLLSVAAVLYLTFIQPLRGESSRPAAWHGALPIRPQQRLLSALTYHLIITLLFATTWAAARHILRAEPSAFVPFAILLPLAIQSQSALLWSAAFGPLRGSAVFAALLALSALLGAALNALGLGEPLALWSLSFLSGGIVSLYLAVYAMRFGWSSIPFAPTRPTATTQMPHTTNEGFTRRMRAALNAAMPTFPSPLWAQVWFEFRRSAMWIPIAGVPVQLLPWLMGDFVTIPLIVAMFILPIGVAYVHNRVNRPYQSFVLTRPLSSQQIGRAKLLSMSFAVFLAQLIVTGPTLLWAVVTDSAHWLQTGDSPDWVNWASIIQTALFQFLLVVYGLLSFAVALLAALFSSFYDSFYNMIHIATMELSGSDWSSASLRATRDMNPGVPVLSVIIALWVLLSSLARKRDNTIPFPPELACLCAALLIMALIPLTTLGEGVQEYARFGFVWVIPPIALALLTTFGLRTHLVSVRDAVVSAAIFLLLYSVGGLIFATTPEDAHENFVNHHFGYWSIVLVSPIYWYPAVITWQRHAHVG